MNPCISHVYSVRVSSNPKQDYNNIRRKVLKFRVHELMELLVFLNRSAIGTKPILQERVLNFLKKEIVYNELLSEKLEAKIEELNELCKIPLRKRGVQFVGPLYDSHIFPMFTELRQLIYGQKFQMEQGQQTFCFTLTAHLVHKIISGEQADGTFRFEVQLNVWNCKHTEEWSDIFLCVEVNHKPIHVHHPSPHLIYLTSQCHFKQSAKNTITISSSRPETLNDYAFCVCVVKRLFPTEIIQNNPVNEVCDTASLISKELEGQVDRKFKMCLACPETKTVIAYPCRSIFCTHPDVFDLKTFLNRNQYYQQWKCPVCMKIIKYEDIVMDMGLKKYLDEGIFNFVFYKRRRDYSLTDNRDEGIHCDVELINIQE